MNKKILLFSTLAVLAAMQANAQTKIGDNPATVNPNAVLELESTNKGLLLPRIALTATTASSPLTAHVAGITVYNTATAGDVTPGYYYDNGTRWVRIADASAADLRLVNGSSHITQDAGVGSNGTSAGGANVIAIGTNAGNVNASGENIFIGSQAGQANTVARANTLIGYQSGQNNKGESNTFVGHLTGQGQTTGRFNTAVGREALYQGTGGTGEENTALGYATLVPNTSGNNNTAAGSRALSKNTTGNENTGFGWQTNFRNTTGSFNTALGSNAAFNTNGGDLNTSLGYATLFSNISGTGNTSIGAGAGSNIITGSQNISIGANSWVPSGTGNFQLSIGNLIYGTGLNGTTSVLSTGNIGIGVKAPNNRLHVAADADPLRLEGLQAGASATTLLTVNANGVVKLASATGAVQTPVGTTADRPANAAFGQIRYNTTTGRGEMYVNDANGDGTQGDTGWRTF